MQKTNHLIGFLVRRKVFICFGVGLRAIRINCLKQVSFKRHLPTFSQKAGS